jgi:hypothetical protein
MNSNKCFEPAERCGFSSPMRSSKSSPNRSEAILVRHVGITTFAYELMKVAGTPEISRADPRYDN